MRVRVRNPEYARRHLWFFAQPEFHDYEGEEVAAQRWENAQEVLCLTTGITDFPVRSIQRKNIISIDGRAVTSPVEAQPQTRVIKGSKGQEYVLTRSAGSWSCTCAGFQFRRRCRHALEA